jgi:hypothetical protein
MAQFYIEALGSEFNNSGRNPISQSQIRFQNLAGVLECWNAGKQADIFSNTPLLQHSITSFQVLKVMGDIR